jgi:hypothetical protein
MKICISLIKMKKDLYITVRPESYNPFFPALMKRVPRAWWNPDLRVWVAPGEPQALDALKQLSGYLIK